MSCLSVNSRLAILSGIGLACLLTLGVVRGIALGRLEKRVDGLKPPLKTYQASAAGAVPDRSLLSTTSSFDEIMWSLDLKKLGILFNYLEKLDDIAAEIPLSDSEIELVVQKLRPIEASDPYQKKRPDWKEKGPPKNPSFFYANRGAATGAINGLGHLKVANALRNLPLEVRLGNIFDLVEGRTPSAGKDASSWFRGELRRIGDDAVPFIIRRAAESTDHQLTYIYVLSKIGNPEALDFIITTLKETKPENTSLRCLIIDPLGTFKHPKAIKALIDAMADSTRATVDSRQHQTFVPGHVAYPIYYYPVRDQARWALANASSKQWDLLFVNDPKTWSAWWAAEDKKNFDPTEVERTDHELARFLEDFTYLAMGELMRNSSWDREGLKDDMKPRAKMLEKMGSRVVPHLVQSYRSISTEFPVWEQELRRWTTLVLTAMDTPEALAAAAELADS